MEDDVYRENRIGSLMMTNKRRAAYELRELLRASNGNGRLVASTLGVTERQLRRWIVTLLDEGVADLRAYRARVRKRVVGAICVDARGRQPEDAE